MPDRADDTEATIDQAVDLWARLDLPKVMIKASGTQAGPPTIQEFTRRGVNVNVTLLFTIARYAGVASCTNAVDRGSSPPAHLRPHQTRTPGSSTSD